MHIVDFVNEDNDFKIGKPYATATNSQNAVSLRSMASYLSITVKRHSGQHPEDAIADEIDEKRSDSVLKFTQSHTYKRYRFAHQDINDKKRLLDPLKSFDLPLDLMAAIAR